MPILPILFLLVGAGVIAFGLGGFSLDSADNGTSDFGQTVGGFPDIDPQNQGGLWKTDFDDSFKRASEKNDVPFALIKAHAIRESALKPNAIRNELATSKRPPSASYGLMQILWWPNSNRFAGYGYNDDFIGDGSILYNTDVNADIAAHLIRENLQRFGTLRDAINAYNTGVGEGTRVAPGNYVNDVLSYYSKLVGKDVA